MREYLDAARKNLDDLEEENKERPPGDVRANIKWAIQRTRDMIIRAEGKLEKGKDIWRDLEQIDVAFDFIAKYR